MIKNILLELILRISKLHQQNKLLIYFKILNKKLNYINFSKIKINTKLKKNKRLIWLFKEKHIPEESLNF